MQEEPAIILARMNRSYNAIYGTVCPEARREAETTFYRCQSRLRQRGIAFRQTHAGQWVLAAAHSQALMPSSHPQLQEDVL